MGKMTSLTSRCSLSLCVFAILSCVLVHTPSVAYAQTVVGEFDECFTIEESPEFSEVCDIGLKCVVPEDAEEGAAGVCLYAADGEECLPTVSPEFQIYCAEGLSCEPVNPGFFGSPGICVADEPAPEPSPEVDMGPTIVGEGDECNGTLPPEFATICDVGLECVVPPGSGFGASGVCVAEEPAPEPSPEVDMGPTIVGEGDECNA